MALRPLDAAQITPNELQVHHIMAMCWFLIRALITFVSVRQMWCPIVTSARFPTATMMVNVEMMTRDWQTAHDSWNVWQETYQRPITQGGWAVPCRAGCEQFTRMRSRARARTKARTTSTSSRHRRSRWETSGCWGAFHGSTSSDVTCIAFWHSMHDNGAQVASSTWRRTWRCKTSWYLFLVSVGPALLCTEMFPLCSIRKHFVCAPLSILHILCTNFCLTLRTHLSSPVQLSFTLEVQRQRCFPAMHRFVWYLLFN